MASTTSKLASLLLLTTSALASSPIRHLEARETQQPIAADFDDKQPLIDAVPAAPQPTSPPFGRYLGSTAVPELLARAVAQSVCGYISGTTGYYPLTCNPGNTCTNSGAYRGCCFDTSCTSSDQYFTQCHDATDPVCQSTTGTLGDNTLCCTRTSLYPYCLTYLWSTSASPGKLFTQYNCDQQKFSGQYILAAEPPATTSSASSSAASSSSASPSSTSAVPSNNVADPGSQSGGSNSSSGGSASNNIGAIVGGVIGGVAVLAIIGFAIWWFKTRKGKGANKAATSADAAGGAGAGAGVAGAAQPPMNQQQPQPQYAQNSGPQQYPPPGFDPRYSGYAPTSPSHTDAGSYYNQQYQAGYQQPYDPSKSPVPQQGTGGSGPNGYYTQQPQHSGGFVAEAPANNPVGVGGTRAELGS